MNLTAHGSLGLRALNVRNGGRVLAVRTIVALALQVAAVVPLWAQASGPAPGQRASRMELSQRATSIEQDLAAKRVKGGTRKQREQELREIRNRLEVGDFRVGDRFLITLRRDSVRSDTASVRDSLKVAVFNLPDISLQGVLRSELNDKMSSHVARFLRDVDVRTNVLTRIAVLGAVRNPGYYYASPDRPISDLVMLAGGPAPDANLKQVEVTRGGTMIVKAKESSRLIKDGRTLEQVNIQSGDEVRIPVKRKINWQLVTQMLFIASSLFFAFIQFIRWYYDRQNQ